MDPQLANMSGALFLRAIAAACVLLCLSTTCVGTAAMPSAFTIKSTRSSSTASGSFSVTGSSRSISLSAGVTYEITCTSGTVVGSIAQRWYRDGSAVTKKIGVSMCGSQSEVYYHDESGNSNNWVLTFCNFSSSLMGSYTCSPSPNDNRTLIIGESNPSIIADRDIISEDDGGTATTQAVFLSGVPTPLPNEVTWFILGNTVTGPNPHKSVTTGGLRFNLFNLATAGIYTCVVNTSAGVSMDSFTVRIRAPPELTLTAQYRYKSKVVFSTSSTFHVPLNANLTFTCTDEHAYPTPTFTWSRNGTDITNVQAVSSNQTKHIQYSVQETNTGPYTCEAGNGVGNTEKTLHIVVIAPPSLTRITDKHTSALVGGKLSLLVAFNAGHKPLTVNWTKVMSGGVLAPIEAGGRVVFDGQHSLNLSIAGVVPKDAGLYELNVVNEVDSVVLRFTVSVFEPPTLTILNPATQDISVPPRSSLTIRVAISSATPAVLSQDIHWSTSEGQKSFNGSLATLQLSDLTGPLSLTLTVSHASGTKTISFNIIIQNPPDPPQSVMLKQLSTCTVLLSWSLPSSMPHTAAADQVQIEQGDAAGQEWREVATVPATQTDARVNLAPNQQVQFRVSSLSSEAGKGTPSGVTEEVSSTVEGFLPHAENLKLIPTSSNSLTISWSSPADTHDCYTVSNYSVICRARDSNIVYNTTVAVSILNSTISDLTPDSRYNCFVAVWMHNKKEQPVKIPGLQPANVANFTLPQPPTRPSRPERVESGITSTTITLDLSSLNAPSSGLVQILVLRLKSARLPEGSPDQLYSSKYQFSTYDEVHSSSTSEYRPYVSAELDSSDLPGTFVIGEEDEHMNKRSSHIENGPLAASNYYTCFVRVYPMSQAGWRYSVFSSSVFMFPAVRLPDPENPGKVSGVAVGVTVPLVIVLLFLVCVIALLGLILFVRYRKRGENEPEISSKHENSKSNEYEFYSPADHLTSMDQSSSTPPQSALPPSTPAEPETPRPIWLNNPTFIELQNNTPPSGLPSPLASEAVESSVVGTESHTQSQPPSEPPNPAEDFEDASSVHEAPFECSLTLTMDRSLSDSKPVAQEDFQEHVLRLDANEQKKFNKQFQKIKATSIQHPCEASKLPENKKKNRYKDIFAFDHSRVTLKCENPEDSDYINANFVPGYGNQKTYIAAQGPMDNTMGDFWKMIWENKTATVVMLTNPFENGRLKCHQYWPNEKEGNRNYDKVNVTLDTTIELQYYIVRSFTITCSGQQRRVLQFHYTGWPDRNVPALAAPLLDFLRAVNSWNNTDQYGPVVIHCSAGVGRTGTIIALDICLDQLNAERQVDVIGVVRDLRQKRTDMVQALAQYIFLHHALLEAIVYGDSSVLLKNFPDHYRQICAADLESSFMGSVTITTTAGVLGCSSVPEPIRNEFDRIGRVHPPSQAYVKPTKIRIDSLFDNVMPVAEFNAYFIDGDNKDKQFIASDCPVGYTCVEQFWCLVWEQRCSHIVMLTPNDSTKSLAYLPEMGQELEFGRLHVTAERTKTMAGYWSRNITLTCDDGTTHTVRHMQYRDWLTKHYSRPVDRFVRFVQECLRESEKGRHVLVHDDGSMGPVGAFLALSHCIQRLDKEGVIDLLQTINRLHLQRPRLLTSVQLYAYCYECLNDLSKQLLAEETRTNESIYENIRSFKPSAPTIHRKEAKMRKYLQSYDIIDL